MAKKYKVKYTTILHNGKTYSEGSTIELEDIEAKRLSDFVSLIPNQTKAKTETKAESKTQSKTQTTAAKTKTDSKSETKTETGADKKDGEDVTEGGTDGE